MRRKTEQMDHDKHTAYGAIEQINLVVDLTRYSFYK